MAAGRGRARGDAVLPVGQRVSSGAMPARQRGVAKPEATQTCQGEADLPVGRGFA